MKQSIDWHKKCLKNQIEYLADLNDRKEQLERECERLTKDIQNYSKQILAAENAGKDGFDDEKFMSKK